MAKTAKSPKKVKVKKVRTAEEKAARKERRKQRRANVKAMATIKESAVSLVPTPKLLTPVFAAVETSDGLPFSKSIDNPHSLLSQMKAMQELAERTEIENKVVALKNFRSTEYAGWTGKAKPNVAQFA